MKLAANLQYCMLQIRCCKNGAAKTVLASGKLASVEYQETKMIAGDVIRLEI
jgi:hypothetical protein